ncbi:putative endonuclease 4 [Tupanvirus deep ocean]|uniref:Endonuclease 4 n=2 Tax=Tupanvirus TaxID=2094720 RepID=A0AC62A7Y5_9VIRU|nr:putative endonuclease 4 [Tupanvirus deep ocean]QKU33780.1 putative endonuclease 4 [Tupanvirus deep ocean]
MTEFRLGRHINISHGFVTAPWYAKSLGCDIFQIFLGAPQQVLSKARQKDDLIKFGKELDKRSLKMVVHGSYTINLCHPKKSKKFQASLKSLVQDLNASADIGKNCLGVIIHMGKNIPENKLTDEQALDNYVVGLQDALASTPSNTRIILETGASQGSEVASEIDGLSEIYWKLEEEERERIFFCVDTCHIWATGYDISTPVGVKRFFKEFDDKIGVEKIICIHFNDSKTGLQSCVDRHADLGYGHIKADGLKAIAQYAQKNKIPLIMETPLDAVNKETNRDVTFEEELTKVKTWLKNKN